ncbi:hypothetical protein Q7C36_001952 [Tachysurus vachellii]|uniref:SEA domain-containing protein n=1 Tax=Tachysurus vachellii TaxID=175792 RepID=A0AA88TGB7_TACVA|nr:hypothetical protein Q7C36_001952 [Tachysurus vachellii]
MPEHHCSKEGLEASSDFNFTSNFSEYQRHLIKERGTQKMKPFLVLLVLIGLLGTSSDNRQPLVHGWSRTDSGLVVPDPQDLNITAINNTVNMLNSLSVEAVNNGTDIKIFREGSQIIIRRYWYPSLAIEVLQSPATTASTTPSPTPTDFTTQTITILSMTSTKMPATESRPAQSSTAPSSTPEVSKATSTISPTSAQETTATTSASITTTLTQNDTTTVKESPTTVPLISILRFTLDMTFTTDLENPLSAAFQTLAKWIEGLLDEIYKKQYSSRYSHCRVNNLAKGSVKVNATLFFADTIPSNSDIEKTLVSAWESNSTSLPLINGTVVAGQSGLSSSSPSADLFSTVTLLLTCVLLVSQTLLSM